MLDMCRALDFQISPDPEDSSIQKVRLKLPADLKEEADPEAVSVQDR
jgi:hypothetical protein